MIKTTEYTEFSYYGISFLGMHILQTLKDTHTSHRHMKSPCKRLFKWERTVSLSYTDREIITHIKVHEKILDIKTVDALPLIYI